MAKKKTIDLNISERLSAISILNQFKGNLDTLAVILEDIRQFSVTDEEWEKADRKVITNGENGENTQWTWDNEKGGLKSIELDDDTVKYIRNDIEKRDKAGEFTLQDRPYITLLEKVK